MRRIRLFRPCFGLSLQTGVEVISVAEILDSFTISAFHAVQLLANLEKLQPSVICIVVLEFVAFLLGCLLLHGAIHRNSTKCQVWIASTIIYSLLVLCIIIWSTFRHTSPVNPSETLRHVELLGLIGYLLLKQYYVWVVWQFCAEISNYGGLNRTLRNLSDSDVEEFLYGTMEDQNENGKKFEKDVGYTGHTAAAKKPFHRNYEICPENLLIDSSTSPIQGTYGVIMKGRLQMPKDKLSSKDVILKTVNPDKVDLSYFKSLLSELKIIVYLGEHANLVSLVGACTSEIRKNKLMIVLEWCENGSMEKFLLKNRVPIFENITTVAGDPGNTAGLSLSDVLHQQCIIDLADLHKWCYEIANGLEYLEIKRVVHTDIAARNILLSNSMHAKIADFGLSIKLHHSCSTGKLDGVLLPWRWMAIESLEHMEFSTKSDIWSYAVTLWEIFTLGQTPFASQYWTKEFLGRLKSGELCLSKPVFATDEIYDLMKRCWNSNPANRPTLSELKSFFSLPKTIQSNFEGQYL